MSPNAPTSVTLQAGDTGTKPLGVEYELKGWVGESKEEKPHRRSSVSMAIRKVRNLFRRAYQFQFQKKKKTEVMAANRE